MYLSSLCFANGNPIQEIADTSENSVRQQKIDHKTIDRNNTFIKQISQHTLEKLKQWQCQKV